MRARGINYDTGFRPGGKLSRVAFDPDVVRREMQVIARDLHCTAVRVTGGDPGRLSVAAEAAAAAGLEVWFAPFPCELGRDDLLAVIADSADRAEHLRAAGAEVVLVTGCELSLFDAGFLPGATVYERIARLGNRGPRQLAAFARLPGRMNTFLGEAAQAARRAFGGRVTYAAGDWEQVDWAPFDLVAVDAYRDAGNTATFAQKVASYRRHGKPVAVTEFGCCPYRGAADKGGMGWAIVRDTDPPALDGDYTRDEGEQVRYLTESLAVFEAAGVDAAFWFTFAGYVFPRRPADPAHDLDLASYGVVSVIDTEAAGAAGAGTGPGTGEYAGLGWTPRASFRALADAYARAPAGQETPQGPQAQWRHDGHHAPAPGRIR